MACEHSMPCLTLPWVYPEVLQSPVFSISGNFLATGKQVLMDTESVSLEMWELCGSVLVIWKEICPESNSTPGAWVGPGQFQPCALSAHLGSLVILGYHGDLRDK